MLLDNKINNMVTGRRFPYSFKIEILDLYSQYFEPWDDKGNLFAILETLFRGWKFYSEYLNDFNKLLGIDSTRNFKLVIIKVDNVEDITLMSFHYRNKLGRSILIDQYTKVQEVFEWLLESGFIHKNSDIMDYQALRNLLGLPKSSIHRIAPPGLMGYSQGYTALDLSENKMTDTQCTVIMDHFPLLKDYNPGFKDIKEEDEE